MGYFKCREVKTGFCRNRSSKPVLLGLSLAGYLVKPFLSLYGTDMEGGWLRTQKAACVNLGRSLPASSIVGELKSSFVIKVALIRKTITPYKRQLGDE